MSTVKHGIPISRPCVLFLSTGDDIPHLQCREAREGRETKAAQA